MLFARDVELGKQQLQAFDSSTRSLGVVPALGKDIDMQLSGVACGVELFEGTALHPCINKLLYTWLSVLRLCESKTASPKEVQSISGALHWYDLLARPKLSVWDHIYTFCRKEPTCSSCDLPSEVCDELLLSLFLSPAWIVNLCDETSPTLVATDGSTSYGIGVSVAPLTSFVADMLASCSASLHDYIILPLLPHHDQHIKTREGNPVELPVPKASFKHVLSLRSTTLERPEVAEVRALKAGIKWLLRSVRHQCTRQYVLLDSQVVRGLATKGRTASRALAYHMKQIMALTLVTSMRLSCLYIPTEYNPSDAPSRGYIRHSARCRL